MKARFLALLALSAVLGATAPVRAQSHDHSGHDHAGHEHAKPALNSAEGDPAMQEWMKNMMPGEAHKGLEFYAGEWTFVNNSEMGGQKSTAHGKTHASMMMGGRYVHASHQSEMMGMPFEGAGVTGYDNMSDEYFNIWFDNMGTGVMVSRGKADKDGVVTMKGTFQDPMMGEVAYRMVSTITSDDSYTFEMFMDTPDGESRVMEILYTRAG